MGKKGKKKSNVFHLSNVPLATAYQKHKETMMINDGEAMSWEAFKKMKRMERKYRKSSKSK